MEEYKSEISHEKKRRINVALWAYAYEVMNDPLVSDSKFDEVCLEIKPEVSTGNDKLDEFFRDEFAPYTGMWIYKHPELKKVATLYTRLTGKQYIMPNIGSKKAIISSAQAAMNAGFKTHLEVINYLSDLGFCVIKEENY